MVKEVILLIPETFFNPTFIGSLRQLAWRPCKKRSNKTVEKG
jgi:hypothetical protein